MDYILITIIIALVGIVVYFQYKLNLQKHYYSYKAEKMDTLEDSLKKEQETHKKTLDRLNKVAYINPISKIGNMDYFISQSCELFLNSEHSHFTLVVFNIDNMATVNKLFGPTEGDKVIIYAASALRKIGQKRRFLFAHLYSNLFGIVVKDMPKQELLDLMEEITNSLREYNESFTIEPSFGIYEVKDISTPVLDMIKMAMLAQKFIKNITECNYNFYTKELEQSFNENKKMSQEMEQAMAEHKFYMYLQPMVDLRTFKITCAEALVRWDYPGKGILSPYAFLPLFEGTSVIEKLDYYMWEECCKTIRRWIDNKIEPTPISMNVSPIHFQNTRFIDKLNQLTEHYLIDKKLLVLELPERGVASGSEEVLSTIRSLNENGYTICIDNFGSMYSPLNLLRDLPIDRIKIDRTFLNKNTDSKEGLTILRYLIAMAKEVDLTVLAEGVETEEQANFLAEIGADVAQGYFFSKPVNLRDFDALNKSMINAVYHSDEYYPTFEDLEKDLDMIDYLLKQA